jgi:peptide/nickel transport system substrate-binding protein
MRKIAFLALVSLISTVLFAPMASAQVYGPKIDVLRNKVIIGPDAQIEAMQTCNVDVLTGLTRTGDIEKLEGEGFTITHTLGFYISFIGFNLRNWPLSDVNFRHALAHSLDKETIVAIVGGYIKLPIDSWVIPAHGGWVNPDVIGHLFNLGDPFDDTVYDPETGAYADTCSILRYGGYIFVDADNTQTVTPPDYWKKDEQPLPEIYVLTPTIEEDPQSFEIIAFWIADLATVAIDLIHEPVPSNFLWSRVYNERNFDVFIIGFHLDRFPDHLYNWFHSSQDLPGGGNCFGVHDPVLDGLLETLKFSLDHTAKIEACWAAQERLDDGNQEWGLPGLPLYTMSYFDAFKPGLLGIVNSPGYGADNMWTYINIHWPVTSPQGGTVAWCVKDEPDIFNPLSGNAYAWKFMDKVFDPLMAVNPYTLEDIPWIATDWEVVTTPIGMDVTYYLRNDVYWQDGLQYTAWDAEFSLEFIRNNTIPKYKPAWQNITDVEVIGDFTFTVHANVTSQFLIYDWAALAALLPPKVWADWNGQPLEQILARDLSTEPGWNGVTPTNLFGTGPFVFQFYDHVLLYGDLWANRNYFLTTTEIHDLKVEMFHRVGDVNRDGYIDIFDLSLIGLSYGCFSWMPCYNPDADLNEDGVVDGRDLAILTWHFGDQREYPVPTEDP